MVLSELKKLPPSSRTRPVPEPNTVRNQATYSPSRNMPRLHLCDAWEYATRIYVDSLRSRRKFGYRKVSASFNENHCDFVRNERKQQHIGKTHQFLAFDGGYSRRTNLSLVDQRSLWFPLSALS